MNAVFKITMLCFGLYYNKLWAQEKNDTTQKINSLNEVNISASRTPESVLSATYGIQLLSEKEAKKFGSLTAFDAIENLKGVQIITPSLGYKVINTRGFTNTNNVRFSQLIDGADNMAPHIGSPIANMFGANDLDVQRIELLPGSAAISYGLNTVNGLVNIITKNPFEYEGVSLQQLTGFNHFGKNALSEPKVYTQTNIRIAKVVTKHLAVKFNVSYTNGTDWMANNETDLAPNINASVGLFGKDNPAYDAVNAYGNESPNRRTLNLNGKNYIVARTGYSEKEVANYGIENINSDAGIYYRGKHKQEISYVYKGSLINGIYQRSNRFRMEDYSMQQHVVRYNHPVFSANSYLTIENTGNSYNLRSLAENLDRVKSNNDNWFTDFKNTFNNAVGSGQTITQALQSARIFSDANRLVAGTDEFNQTKNILTQINNWDKGAALKVNANLWHTDAVLHWHQLNKSFFTKHNLKFSTGLDFRKFIIIPDGNYFINPTDSQNNLTFGKTGGFAHLQKKYFSNNLIVDFTIRTDKVDFFNLKFAPRFAISYAQNKQYYYRISYQNSYRFPSIFEGFSNINSGGVKRVGGLPVMSKGIFENAFTKTSIDNFKLAVNSQINNNGLTQQQAIEANKHLLQKNTYTYLNPEQVNALEFGFKYLSSNQKLLLDLDVYYNAFTNFIAQIEASVPKTNLLDSIPYFFYSDTKQDKYRLWTNSKSTVHNFGASIGFRYVINNKITMLSHVNYAQIANTEFKDGLEDGFNTPAFMFNTTLQVNHIFKNVGGSITHKYQTAFNYVSFLVSGIVPAYSVFDAQLNYQIFKQSLMFKIGATNILNNYYYSILGGPSIGGMYYVSLIIN